ncbi:BCCT family transporter [Acuticoccus sp. M5D2P5]|uniref:BCCT family transporter n=1 Tax=Acuticoccus kalidii TaxID=2910977 RepID=UPI001F3ABB78|nr:BCCT family transporter [Acuticoccus kalidii]
MTDTAPRPQTWRDSFRLIDRPTFFGAIGLLLVATLPLAFWPTEGALWVGVARSFMVDKIGSAYLILGLAAFFFMVYVVLSKVGKIKLGDPNEPPEFPLGSWAAMLFCGGIGASILYWGMIEWAYYYTAPPFGIEPGSRAASEWAAAYGMFHWGPIAWSIYLIPALPIAYFYYVRRRAALKISIAVMPVIGQRAAEGWPGKIVDILFIFGLLGGAATTLGLAAPLISQGANILFGIPMSIVSQIGALLVCTVIFALSSYAGLGRGLKLLSNINLWMAVALLVFVLVVGPTVFLLETGLSSFGRMLADFFIMSTYTESFGGWGGYGDSHFPQDWTIFYWAWWLVFAPSMGLFIARISRGRTIGEMVAGSIVFGSIGCFLFFIVLGNYGLWLQISGGLDVVTILDGEDSFAAIFAILDTLPLTWLVVLTFTILAILFTATSFDSISYILASVVQNDVSEEPMAWNRLFWALALTFLPAVLLVVGGLDTLQTAAIVGGVPLIVITVMLCIATVRVTRLDLRQQSDYTDPIINIEDMPRIDPWSPEGAALARFEQRRAEASAAASREREALDALITYKHNLRRRYGPFGTFQADGPPADTAEMKRLEELEASYNQATERKSKATRTAQEARATFDRLILDVNAA